MTVTFAVATPCHHRVHIVRRHILDQLAATSASLVTSIYAPAGYGKTTAAAQLAKSLSHAGRPVVWINAQSGQAGVAALTRALRCADEAVSLYQADDLNSAERRGILPGLKQGRPVLVIDDAQALGSDELAPLGQMIRNAGDALTTIIASRNHSGIPLCRMRSMGLVHEVGISQLRFTAAETVEYAKLALGSAPDAEALHKIIQDTEGWPAGIAMIAAALPNAISQDHNASRHIRLEREIEAYFDEEVMSHQSASVREFIACTSVLETLTPAACAGVTGQDEGRQRLEFAEQTGIFVQQVQPDTYEYRYHPLFRRMLLRRLSDRDPARASELHRRASRHFASMNSLDKAVDHAEMSGDAAFLADQLEVLADPLICKGRLGRIDQLASDLPHDLLQTRPNLALALAWCRSRSRAFGAADALIETAQAALDARRENDGPPFKRRNQALSRVIDHRRIMMDAAQDNLENIVNPAQSLLSELKSDQYYLASTLSAQVINARSGLFQLQNIMLLEAEARQLLRQAASPHARASLAATIAPALVGGGRTATARAILEHALAEAEAIEAPECARSLAALPAMPLAELYYDLGGHDRARTLIDSYLEASREQGFVDQLAAGHLIHARLLDLDRDSSASSKALDEAQLIALEHGFERMSAYVLAERVRQMTRDGDFKLAERTLNDSALQPRGEPLPTLSTTRRDESVAIAWLRIQTLKHDLFAARKVARRWIGFARRAGAVRSVVIFELLLARIAVQSGDISEARRVLRDAVTLAAPTGWSQIFLDEGAAIGQLLIDAYDGPCSDLPADQFAQALRAQFQGPSIVLAPVEESGLGGRLMHRELEILRMVAAGLRNREIGNRVGLTEGTVKWYMQQIYDKLGVRRRPQAVSRALQLGLLSDSATSRLERLKVSPAEASAADFPQQDRPTRQALC